MTQINWQYQVNNRAGGYIVTNTDWNDVAGDLRALIDQTTSSTTDNTPLPIGIDLANDRVYISDPDSTTPEDGNHADTTLSVVGTTTLAGDTQQTGAFTVGVDGSGHDVKLFGTTSGVYSLWDEDADEWTFVGADLDMDDNAVIRLGTGDDLLVYASGSNSFIDHSGDGDLWIRTLGAGEDLYLNAKDAMALQTDSVTRIYIDAATNVGVATTSPHEKLDVNGNIAFNNEITGVPLTDGAASAYINFHGYQGGNTQYRNLGIYNGREGAIATFVGASTNVQVGYAGDYGGLNPLMLLYPLDGHGPTLFINCYDSADTAVKFYSRTSGSPHDAGQITVNAASVAYASNSDYRLKENVADLTGAMDRVKQLRPVNFTWIAEPECGTIDGFIAHEVDEVVPQAVVGVKDAVLPAVEAVEAVASVAATYDEDGNELTAAVSEVTAVDPLPERPDPQSLDTSHLVPLLTAAVQELEARIAALEAA